MKLNTLLKELHTDKEKVEIVKIKRQAALGQIESARIIMNNAQRILDQATSNYARKIKTFKILDIILAEHNFEVKQKAEAAEQAKKRSGKTAKQTLADIMKCLKELPEAQRLQVIKAMEEKQNGGKS